MLKRASLYGAAALSILPILAGGQALAAPCVSAPVATYTAGGFSCNVDGFTFSNIVVNTTVSNGGSVTLGNFTPVNPLPGEFGLLLNYTALAPAANSTADITWTYNVTGEKSRTTDPGALSDNVMPLLNTSETCAWPEPVVLPASAKYASPM